jgi:hypothetical protein
VYPSIPSFYSASSFHCPNLYKRMAVMCGSKQFYLLSVKVVKYLLLAFGLVDLVFYLAFEELAFSSVRLFYLDEQTYCIKP